MATASVGGLPQHMLRSPSPDLYSTLELSTGCLKKKWVLPNWASGDPAASWEEILMIFVANLQMLNSVKLSFFWDTLYLCPHNWWYLGPLKTTSPLRLEEVLWLCHHIGRPLYFGKCSHAQVTLSFHPMFASRSPFLYIKNDAFAHIHPITKLVNWVFNMLWPHLLRPKVSIYDAKRFPTPWASVSTFIFSAINQHLKWKTILLCKFHFSSK